MGGRSSSSFTSYPLAIPDPCKTTWINMDKTSGVTQMPVVEAAGGGKVFARAYVCTCVRVHVCVCP